MYKVFYDVVLSFSKINTANYHRDPFRVMKGYFTENGGSTITKTLNYIEQKLSIAEDRVDDQCYEKETSYYAGRVATLKDIRAILSADTGMVE